MKPVLFFIGGIPFTSWSITYAVGFLVVFWWAYREGKRTGVGGDRMMDVGIWIFFGTMAGARIMHVIDDWDYIRNDFVEVFRFWNGGFVLYGGILGGFVAAVTSMRIMKVPILKAGDIVLQSVALGLVFGRAGCFLNGCCYGRPTHVPWAVTFDDPTSIARNIAGIPVHPTQLYSTALLLGLFFLLICIDRKKKFDGLTMWVFYMLYSAGRFVLEFFRGDPRGVIEEPVLSSLFTKLFGPQAYSSTTAYGFTTSPYLSESQFVSMFIFACSLGALLYYRAKYKKSILPA